MAPRQLRECISWTVLQRAETCQPSRPRSTKPAYARTLGIDYSGAQTPAASLQGLRAYLSEEAA